MANLSKIVITCAPRLIDITTQEITDIGYKVLNKDRLSATIHGTFEDCMYLNLHLRTANKVLYHLKEFKAKTPDHLYRELSDIAWERMIKSTGYISINGFVRNDSIKDTRFANMKAKDAIVDRIQKMKGRRPDSGPDQTRTMIYLHWKDDNANIYIDTSGETISKHGYRRLPHKAPMAESLAAACIMTSKWDKKSPFINPMCGSGTLAIEAALLAINKAPGLIRNNFGFMHVNFYDEFKWNKMCKEAEKAVNLNNKPLILANDLDEQAIRATKENARLAGVDHHIAYNLGDFRDIKVPDTSGVIMINPEYGLRLGEVKELEETYSHIGDFFKQKAKGYTGYIFTANLDLAKKIGLKTKRRVELFNAKLDARLLEYELYAGSKKNTNLNS